MILIVDFSFILLFYFPSPLLSSVCQLPELSCVFWQAVLSRTLVVFRGLLHAGVKE